MDAPENHSPTAPRQEDERLRYVVMATRDAIYDWDIRAGTVWRNEVYGELYAPPEPVGPDEAWWQGPVHPDDRLRVIEAIARAFREQQRLWSEEYRFRRSTGSYASIIDRGYILYDPMGQAVRMIGAIMDVTEHRRAEEALRVSARRYRALVEVVSHGVWVHDPEADVGTSDDGARWWEELTGQPRAEQAGWGWLDVVHPDDRAYVRDLWTRCRESATAYDVEYRVRAREGGYRHLHVRGLPIRSNGAVHEWAGVLTDVTDHRRAEQALRENEERFRQIFESRMIGIAFWDAAGGISEANDTFLDLVGYTREDLLAGRVRWRDLTPPEYTDLDDRVLAELAETGVCTPFEKEYVRKDGRRIPVFLGGSLLDSQRDRGVGFVLDLSERKRAEAALRHSEERFRAFMDHSPAAAWITDADGRMLYLSATARRMLRLPSVEPVGLTVFDLFPERMAQVYLDGTRKAIRAGRAVEGVEPGLRADGSEGSFLVYRFPLAEPGGAHSVAGVAMDITELKLLEEQLRQAQKMEAIGQLAGGVAHDFNNLLTVIGGRSQLLLRRLAPDDPNLRHVELIARTVDRAEGLTRQLLAFSRKQALQPRVLDLNAVVGGVERMLRRLIGEDIELVWAPGIDLGRVRADAGQLEQLLMNLAVNARDAMPAGGQLRIETASVDLDQAFANSNPGARPGAYVMVAVADTGTGMDAETCARCFEPFFTTKTAGHGTGLGLSTVYGIVKQHEGYIRVESERGRGTTFRIYLPRVDELPEPSPDRLPAAEVRGGRETILLVEDEEGVRTVTEEILRGLGYTVLTARHAPEALAVSEQYDGTIQLLLTDVVMPGLTGRQLAEHLRVARPWIRVLYVSGYTDDAVLLRGIGGAGITLLPKPFTPEGLARKVREVLDVPGT